MQEEQTNYQIVLPTNQIIKGLTNNQAVPQAQFLVGYRNILTCKEGTTSWGLVKSKLHCGRAFVFPISQSEALAIQHFKSGGEVIERVGNSFIILKVEGEVLNPTSKLSAETIQKLLQVLGGVNKINLNILKNVFESDQEYRSIVDAETQRTFAIEESIKDLDLAQKVKIEYNAKNLSGKALRQLPLVSKQTGNWSDSGSVELKVLQH